MDSLGSWLKVIVLYYFGAFLLQIESVMHRQDREKKIGAYFSKANRFLLHKHFNKARLFVKLKTVLQI
jgi:hypothetical protein